MRTQRFLAARKHPAEERLLLLEGAKLAEALGEVDRRGDRLLVMGTQRLRQLGVDEAQMRQFLVLLLHVSDVHRFLLDARAPDDGRHRWAQRLGLRFVFGSATTRGHKLLWHQGARGCIILSGTARGGTGA